MCLIVFAWGVHPDWPLLLAANRDEFHARPTAAAATLADQPDVFGGIDLRAGGSWLLASRRRRMAAITNVRVGLATEVRPRSRGMLVKAFVEGVMDGKSYAASIAANAREFGPFNMLLWDGASMQCVGNHPGFHGDAVAPGVHTLSNAYLDAGWPKARRLRSAMEHWLTTGAAGKRLFDPAPMFAALADTSPADDGQLPDTGIGLELERRLSSPFVRSDSYGTRCSTVVFAGASGIGMIERRFDADGMINGESRAGDVNPTPR